MEHGTESPLVNRFPDATPEELLRAYAYAYGGAIIQHMDPPTPAVERLNMNSFNETLVGRQPSWRGLECHGDVMPALWKCFYFRLRSESRTLVSNAREAARSLSFAISENALSISA